MSPKFESEPTLTSVSEKVQTIAIFSVASRQILEDLGDLAMFLQTSQKYYLDLAVELQLLAGDGVDPQLNGLIPQAASFNTGLLVGSAGYNRIDIVGRAIQQIQRSKEIAPSWVVLNPDDWWSARLQKDSLGRYILGDPSQTAEAQLFDLTVLSTVNITPGTFLLGNSSPIASELRIRSEVTYEIATQNEDQFVKNLITARSECRLALITKRPGSFVTGTFVTSPSM
jgi:HK97 family phage major capsid protein